MDLLDSQYRKIGGVLHVKSQKTGPSIIISCLTHGGETAGLEAVNFLINYLDNSASLLCGDIYFTLNNIKAYEKYLQIGLFREARYIDENMNRATENQHIQSSSTYESKRLQELYPLLSKANYHIDLHSTTQSSHSMAIYSSKSEAIFRSILNVDHHYSGIIQQQRGKPVIDICERNGGVGIGLESGRQDDQQAYCVSVDNILRILSYLKMITISSVQQYILPNKSNLFYTIYDKVFVKDKNNFTLSKRFKQGEFVKKGTIIGIQDNVPILAQQDSIIIMPSDVRYSNEEYCFLAVA